MGFVRGIINFTLMIVLSICLMVLFGYGLLNSSVLSFEANKTVIEETAFTEELTSEVLQRYNTKLVDLSVDDDVLLSFINESGLGVIGYVLSETESMPSVDVTFLKDYVIKNVTVEEAGKVYGNVDFDEMITALREIPEGESVSNNFDMFLEEKNLSIHQADVDKVTELYLENKELDDQMLKEKIISEMAYDKLNLNDMYTELSLQSLFDDLMDRNPFTLIREMLNTVNKNIYGYMAITMVILFLMILIVEFRIGSFTVWIALALMIAIIPVQAIRLVNIIVDQELFDIFNGMESYKNYMLDVIIDKLNVYTIVSVVLIVLLFVISKVARKNLDDKIEPVEGKKQNRYVIVRFAVFAILAFGLFLNVKGMYRYDMNKYEEIQSIQPDDFDPKDLDITLSELLNINYDF